MNQFEGMFTLGWNDIGKGLVIAVIGAVLVAAQGMLLSTSHVIDWHLVGYAAEVAGIGYLIKNFFSNNQGQFGGVVG